MTTSVGSVRVHTTQNRGHTPAELASMCADRIVAVSDAAPPEIRDQARAYKTAIEALVETYLRRAISSDRVTIANNLRSSGHAGLADAIKRM